MKDFKYLFPFALLLLNWNILSINARLIYYENDISADFQNTKFKEYFFKFCSW